MEKIDRAHERVPTPGRDIRIGRCGDGAGIEWKEAYTTLTGG